MENRNKFLGINRKAVVFFHRLMLVGMLHSTFIAPCQSMLQDVYGYNKKEHNTYRNYGNTTPTKNNLEQNTSIKPTIHYNPQSKKVDSIINPLKLENFTISADINQGIIGISNVNPLDDAKDNLFKFYIQDFEKQKHKAYLTYELFGVQNSLAVSRSINDRPSTGGHIIKEQKGWTTQREEIDANWLNIGENKILFTIPEGANYQYQVKNVKIEFNAENSINSSLIVANSNLNYIKDNSLYVKGFVKNHGADVKIFIEDTPLIVNDGAYEGFLKLTDAIKARQFVMIKAFDKNGLLGQELLSLDHLLEADKIIAIEENYKSESTYVKAKTNATLKLDATVLKINDSALIEDKEISISKLRKVDIAPLSSGLINVTKGGIAYRFLPDGTKFNNPVSIEIGYDENLLPKGHTVNEIKTFYFNTKTKEWTVIERDTINKNEKTITSLTNHFTDYINGIIQTPESPETAGFTPTMMSDVKAVDPSSEMTLISPPEVSQKGDANVNYPIKIPAGRKGMQPQLALQYSNEAGSGWTGLGWNIGSSSISLDTKWGIPLLDPDYETEIYNINGEQLMYPKLNGNDWMPNRHSAPDSDPTDYSTGARDRIANAIFTPRKQGSLTTIERLGTSPNNYYWKVTKNDGSIDWYGGKDGVVENSVIKNENGNIVHWSLYLSEDIHKNNIKYKYTENQILTGLSGENENLNNGKLHYLKEILYTGFNGADGAYKIVFNTSNIVRQDPSFDSRLGVKKLDVFLLNEIVVYNTLMEDEVIRKYSFTYSVGRFSKSLLSKITEKDKNNNEFYSHTFDYYDDVALNSNNLFINSERVIIPDFNPSFTLGFGSLLDPSSISSNENIDVGYNVRPSFGFEIRTGKHSKSPKKTFTLGMPFGENYLKGKGKISLTDIDGDGMDDVVFRDSSGIKYIPNKTIELSTDDGLYGDGLYFSFHESEIKDVQGISDFYKSNGGSKTMFLESWDLMFKKKYYVGTKRVKSHSNTTSFFVDGNNDGLMDISKNGTVYFNYIADGLPTFTSDSSLTPNMVVTADPSDLEWQDPEPEEENEINTDFDIVKVWVAPENCKVKINDVISIINPTATSSATYSIETMRGSNKRIYLKTLNFSDSNETIELTHYDPSVPLSNGLNTEIELIKGQRIYFRLHKNLVGIDEEVSTNPTVTILSANNFVIDSNFKDENNISYISSNYNNSFFLSGDGTTEITGNGQIQVSWNNFNVNQPSDDVIFKIEKISATGDVSNLYIKNCAMSASTVVSVANNELSNTTGIFSVNEGDEINFQVLSDSNVNFGSAIWKPKLIFTPDDVVTEDGVVPFSIYPIPNYSLYYCDGYTKKIDQSILSCFAPSTSSNVFSVKPTNIIDGTNYLLTTDNASFKFIVKKNGVTLGKRIVNIENGLIIIPDTTPIPFFSGSLANFNEFSKTSVMFYIDGKNNKEVFDRYFKSINFKILVGVNSTFYSNSDLSSCSIPNALLKPGIYTNDLQHLGPLNKNWGQFLYNANFDENPLTLFDDYGKLINEDIISNPYGIIPTSFYEPGSCNPSTMSAEEYDECVENTLGSPGSLDVPEDYDTMSDEEMESAISSAESFVSDIESPCYALLPTRPYRNLITASGVDTFEEKWLGFYDTQFSSSTSFKTGKFSNSMFDNIMVDTDTEVVTEPMNPYTGMFSITKKHKSSSRSFTIGRGKFNLSKSKSGYSTTLTDFRDINGDGYPDILYSDKFQETNMTGGHKYSTPNINFGNVDKFENKNKALTTYGNHTTAGRAIKGTNDSGTNRKDTGSIKGTVGISVTANLGGQNKPTTFWMDLNGDGLPEKITKNEGELKYQLSSILNSSGITSYNNEKFFNLIPSNNYSSGFDFGISAGIIGEDFFNNSVGFSLTGGYSSTKGDTEITYHDINGDGLVDMIKPGVVSFNKGNGFNTSVYPLTETYTGSMNLEKDSKNKGLSLSGSISYFHGFPICCAFLPILHIKAGVTVGGEANVSIAEGYKDFRDMNGDGFLDYVQFDSSALIVNFSAIRRTNKLKTVVNPLGGEFEVNYKAIPKTYDNPYPKWVMSELIIKDKTNKVNDGIDVYKKKFQYENAYYDRRERQFYGFENVKVIDFIDVSGEPEIYRTSVSKYHNKSYFLNGLLKESYLMNASSQLYSLTTNQYEIRRLNTANNSITTEVLPNNFDVGGKEGRRTAAVLLTKTNQEIFEFSGSPIVTETLLNYDSKGRVTQYLNKGNIADSTDDYTSIIEYHDTMDALNIINVPKSIKVNNLAGETLRERRTQVDSSNGNILTIAAKNGGTWLETNMTYDIYGNLKQIKYPVNNNGEAMFYAYEYDNDYHKYIVQIKDAFGYVSTANYNSNFDKIVETTDMTGNQMLYTYDNFGRSTTILGPKEIAEGKPYTIRFNYYPYLSSLPSSAGATADNFVPVAVTSHYDQQHPTNDIQTFTFIDGLARPIQVKKDIYINKGTVTDPNFIEALSVSGKSYYDEFGRVTKQFHPYFEVKYVSTMFLLNEHESTYFSSTDYDVLDRAIKSVDPEGNISTVKYSITADIEGIIAFKTKSDVEQNDSQHIITETYKDVSGKVISTKNEGGTTGSIWTKFKYNPIGELLSYADAQNISTTYKYDMLGRKIMVTHPDNGTTKFTYDNVNLVSLQTANLGEDETTIDYKYEYNRLLEVIYPVTPDGNPNIANVSYKYGDSGNETGRLIWQKDATGTQEFVYGDMGEMIANTRTVVGPNIPTRVFKTLFNYDSWNRLQEIQYPDGEKVSYAYDLGGNLNRVSGFYSHTPYDYIKRIDYDHYEQRTYLQYGNNTETFYKYTPALRRLENLNVKTSDTHDLFSNKYNYDKVGNILGVENTAPVTANNMAGKYLHKYSYDNLNRLISAQGTFNGSIEQIGLGNDANSNYTLKMEYNNTHGITTKQQNHIKNGNAFVENCYSNKYNYFENTHKIKTISDASSTNYENFAYDLNGNIVYRETNTSNRRFAWDESNRLRVVTDSHDMQHYIYDAGGERVLKASSDTEAIFENGTLLTPETVVINGYTSYPSAFIVITADGVYSKHYYAGSQRIVSRLGDDDASIFEDCEGCKEASTKNSFDPKQLQQDQKTDLQAYADQLKIGKITYKDYKPIPLADQQQAIDEENKENDSTKTLAAKAPEIAPMYFYHPDHLGTNTALTDFNGNAYQFFINLPFGETMAQQLGSNYYTSPYKFNGKELDDETGFYYYGARYYDPRISVWMSVDPLAEKMPSWSPYSFCFNNPMRFVDPDGKEPTPAEAARMAAHVYGDKKNGILTGGWKVSNRDFGLTKKDLNNTATGLRSQIYERTVNGKTEYTYATAGTEASWKDVGADVKQPLGLSKQYEKSADNAKTISKVLGETELTFTGHSLGGGEAALNALLTDRNAITFNAAGVSDITKVVEGNWKTPFKSEDNIEAYIMATDPLNTAQDLSPIMPNVNGNRNYLVPTDGSSIYNGHSMNNVLKNFGVTKPETYDK